MPDPSRRFSNLVEPNNGSGIGARVQRREDLPLVTGAGRFVADTVLPAEAHAVFVRSLHPHAKIAAIDSSAALAVAGVLTVLTGREAQADGLGGIPWEVRPPVPKGVDEKTLPPMGSPEVAAPQPIIARDTVRYVGEIIAIVVAETVYAARDAAERLIVDYEPLPFVVATGAESDAPQIWPTSPGNICFTFRKGDAAVVDAAFAQAHHITRLDLTNTRLAANPIETRAYIGAYDASTERYTLHASAGKPNPIKRTLARDVFGIAPERIRVITHDVGGGFGSKNVAYAEEALVLWAARRLGRPVKWIADRSESFISDVQGRDQVNRSELALDRDGRFLALRISSTVNLGAYLGPRGVVPVLSGTKLLASVYRLPAAYYEISAVFRHTVPTCPYRGAGHPEVIFQVERLVDTAAREMGIDPAELRRRNLVPASEMPHQTVADVVYDCGDFERNMADALELANWHDFSARRRAARARGRLRGIGIANCLEAGSFGPGQKAWVDVDANGFVTVLMGTQSSGQSHATVYSQIVAEALGVPLGDVRIIQGDTDVVPGGDGTGGCRSMVIDGCALQATVRALIEKGRRVAAAALEAAEEDIDFAKGHYRVVGTDRAISFRTVAGAASVAGEALGAVESYQPSTSTFPNGCHICEVEVDPETGATEVLSYVMVHDAGRILNPMVVEGQLHGGVAQGIGQALMEHAIWEPDSGQMISGSFMDYAMPRADTVPSYLLTMHEVPTATNPLGVKGVGEAGPTAAPPAVINAIVDALSPYNVRHVPMPATPFAVWQAIEAAKKGG